MWSRVSRSPLQSLSSSLFILSFLSILFIYRYANLPNIHSFPTRRSSDLPLGRGDGVHRVDAADGVQWLPPLRSVVPRSEEHTSELQSPMYLVCRLLLEKKNNIR